MPPSPSQTKDGHFQGFADSQRRFFREVAAHQDGAWFRRHRDVYEAGWHRPMQALLGDLHAPLQAQHRGLMLREPRLFRIYRDVRFSADKAPLKTEVSGVIEVEGAAASGARRSQQVTALYCAVGLEVHCAAGAYVLETPSLARFRADVLDARRGPRLVRMLERLTAQGYRVGAYASLKTVPRGLPRDHPRAALLRLKGLVVSFPKFPLATLTKPALVAHLAGAAGKAAALVDCLGELDGRA